MTIVYHIDCLERVGFAFSNRVNKSLYRVFPLYKLRVTVFLRFIALDLTRAVTVTVTVTTKSDSNASICDSVKYHTTLSGYQ